MAHWGGVEASDGIGHRRTSGIRPRSTSESGPVDASISPESHIDHARPDFMLTTLAWPHTLSRSGSGPLSSLSLEGFGIH